MRVCGRMLLHKNRKFRLLQASVHAALAIFVERFLSDPMPFFRTGQQVQRHGPNCK